MFHRTNSPFRFATLVGLPLASVAIALPPSLLATTLPTAAAAAEQTTQPATSQSPAAKPPATKPTTTKPLPPALPPNSLELTEPDPLLPNPTIKRLLSPLEKVELRKNLDKLTQEGSKARFDGDRPTAYRTWFRELRLRRFLGPDDEITALTRVGQSAWDDNQRLEVQLITQRLDKLQTQRDPELTRPQLNQIGLAYETLRAMPQAIAYHEAALNRLRSQSKPGSVPYGSTSPASTNPVTSASRPARPTRPTTASPSGFTPSLLKPKPTQTSTPALRPVSPEEFHLTALARLYFNSFEYAKAADRTQDLLQLTRATPLAQRQPREELGHLEQLVFIHQKNRQYDRALTFQSELLKQYQDPLALPTEGPKIPSLQQAIARNQEAAGQLIAATQTYQEAYRSALALQQLGLAQEAASTLAQLYSRQNQPQDALKIYEIVLDIDQRSYNLYGLIDTHSRMGDLYRQQSQNIAARQSYQQALHLAQQLNYQVSEIQEKLTQLPGQ